MLVPSDALRSEQASSYCSACGSKAASDSAISRLQANLQRRVVDTFDRMGAREITLCTLLAGILLVRADRI